MDTPTPLRRTMLNIHSTAVERDTGLIRHAVADYATVAAAAFGIEIREVGGGRALTEEGAYRGPDGTVLMADNDFEVIGATDRQEATIVAALTERTGRPIDVWYLAVADTEAEPSVEPPAGPLPSFIEQEHEDRGVYNPGGEDNRSHVMTWHKQPSGPRPFVGFCSCEDWSSASRTRPLLFASHSEHIAQVASQEPEPNEWCVRLDNGHIIGVPLPTREAAESHRQTQQRLVYGDPAYGTTLHIASRHVTPWKDES